MTTARMDVAVEIAAIQMLLHGLIGLAAQSAPEVLAPVNEFLTDMAKDDRLMFTGDDGRSFTVADAARRAAQLMAQAGGRAGSGVIQ